MTDKYGTKVVSDWSAHVDQCEVVFTPTKNENEVLMKSSIFPFQKSKCYLKINQWGGVNDSFIRAYLKSEPMLCTNFYVKVIAFKGEKCIFFPRKYICDTNRCIWESGFSAIASQLPNACNWNFSLQFLLQTDLKKNYQEKSAGHKFVQTETTKVDYCLEKLSEDLGKLAAKASPSCDIKLKCGDYTIYVNEAILAARLTNFKKMHIEKTADGTKRAEIGYMDLDVFKEFIRYIHTGKLHNLNFDIAKKMYKVAALFGVQCLLQLCVNYMMENLTVENACECVEIALEDTFKENVVNFMISNKVPQLDKYWEQFCKKEQNKTLALEVANKFIRQS